MSIVATNTTKAQERDNNIVPLDRNSEIELIEFLEMSHKKLAWYANPINPDGFIKCWGKWVIEHWPEYRFRTYNDFIHGDSYLSFDMYYNGLSFLFYEAVVDEFNIIMKQDGEHISKYVNSYVSLIIDKKIDNDFKLSTTNWNKMLSELYHKGDYFIDTHEKIIKACEPIMNDFTETGVTILPEILSRLGYMPSWKVLDVNGNARGNIFKRDFNSWASDLTLAQIKQTFAN